MRTIYSYVSKEMLLNSQEDDPLLLLSASNNNIQLNIEIQFTVKSIVIFQQTDIPTKNASTDGHLSATASSKQFPQEPWNLSVSTPFWCPVGSDPLSTHAHCKQSGLLLSSKMYESNINIGLHDNHLSVSLDPMLDIASACHTPFFIGVEV